MGGGGGGVEMEGGKEVEGGGLAALAVGGKFAGRFITVYSGGMEYARGMADCTMP